MALSDIIGFVDRLKLVQGVENDLRVRRRIGTWAGLLAIVFQVLVIAIDKNYLEKLGRFLFNIATRRWSEVFAGDHRLYGYELVAALALIAGSVIYVLVRRTRFFLRDSKEPFRYTFSVDAFKRLTASNTPEGKPAEALALDPEGRFRLLHHDLMDKLSTSIRRLSLLNLAGLPSLAGRDLSSHIHISGHYFVAQTPASDAAGTKPAVTVEIMPRIRIGPPDKPEQLAPRITLSFKETDTLSEANYAHIVEHVYSRIATAVYQRIREDIREKISLYPTPYVRAVGLFYEAEDFEQSNTVDAYDHAIDLYREALRYFDVRRLRFWSRGLLKLPLLWRFVSRSQLLEARARVAYSRCLINRRIVSGLSGSTENPLFEVPEQLEKALAPLKRLHSASSRQSLPETSDRMTRRNIFVLIMRYLTYPRTAASSRRRPVFDENRQALFEAYVVLSLAYSQLQAAERARAVLKLALAAAPDIADRSSLYLLAMADTIPDLNQRLYFLVKASELAPTSEIVRYQLARFSSWRFRLRDEMVVGRAKPIIESFWAVQRINPGNIGVYAATGYLWWLVGKTQEAEREYEEGLSVKAIRQQTFVGDLSYGLARIAAETGNFNRAFDYYAQAVAADPGVGSPTPVRTLNEYYEYMNDSMLARYEEFAKRVRTKARELSKQPTPQGNGANDPAVDKVSERTVNVVLGFALNDLANACLQYHMRSGQIEFIHRAIAHYQEAIALNPESAVTYYNLSSALSWTSDSTEQAADYLERAEKLAPSWRLLLIQSIETSLGRYTKSIRDIQTNNQRLEQRRAELAKELATVQSEEQRPRVLIQSGVDLTVGGGPDVALQQDQETQKRKNQLSKDISDCEAQITRNEDEVERLRNEQRTRALPKLKRIAGASAFAGFFEGLEIDDPAAMKRFLKRPPRKDQVDEDFVDLLRVWALLASTETENQDTLQACTNLLNYVLDQFYPEHFRVQLSLLDLYSRLPNEPQNRHGVVSSLWAVRSAIEESLGSDPSRWYYLDWASYFFDRELFRLDPVLSGILNNGFATAETWQTIPEDLRKAFYTNGVSLSSEAHGRALMNEPEWEIADADMPQAYRLSVDNISNWIIVKFANRGIIETLITAVENLDADRDKQKLAVLNSLLAMQYAAIGQDEKALDQYQRAARNNPHNAAYEVNLGDHYYQKFKYKEAADAYNRALRRKGNQDVWWAKLSWAEEAGASAAAEPSEYWRRAVNALVNAVRLAPDNADYKARLERAREQFKLHDYVGGTVMFPVVTPVAIEFGGDLPIDENTRNPLWDAEYEKLRAAIEGETGVHLPLARWRSDPALQPGLYRLLINEIPAGMGFVAAEPPVDYLEPIKHLERVLRTRLEDFFGHQEVLNTLELADHNLFLYFTTHFEQLADLVRSARARLAGGQDVRALAQLAEEIRNKSQGANSGTAGIVPAAPPNPVHAGA